jgi:hypothetical protein
MTTSHRRSATGPSDDRAVVAPLAGSDPEGHLADGWEPYRPLADGLLRRFVHAYASSFCGMVHHLGGRVVRRDAYVVWDLGRPSGFLNGAMLLRPLPYDGWHESIEALERDVLRGGTGEVTVMSPFPTPDLASSGWRLVGHPPLLLRDRVEPMPSTPRWLTVRPVRDTRTIADWERVAIQGYPFPDVPDGAGALVDDRVLADPSFHAWIAYVDDDAVAIGTSYTVHGLHVMALGATLPDHRGRGIWDALTRVRLASFPSLPAAGLFSDDSRSPAERLGFRALSRWTVWSRDRTDRPSL